MFTKVYVVCLTVSDLTEGISRRLTTVYHEKYCPSMTAQRLLRPSRGSTVLVVEDDRSNRDLISKVLCQDGHQILQACDGAIALEMLQTLRCDLVITDFLMPKLNGIKFVEQLHTLQPRMPIILITGYLSAVSGIPIVDKVADVLAKPFDLNVLRSTVRRLLDTTPHATP